MFKSKTFLSVILILLILCVFNIGVYYAVVQYVNSHYAKNNNTSVSKLYQLDKELSKFFTTTNTNSLMNLTEQKIKFNGKIVPSDKLRDIIKSDDCVKDELYFQLNTNNLITEELVQKTKELCVNLSKFRKIKQDQLNVFNVVNG